ncbi:MAG: PadR family transcriptional regulator [Candidatus Promineifilaceae bacterium]
MSLKHAILGFLSLSPLSGYDLKKTFDRSVQHFWPANQSQIYRTLAELDEQGLVSKEVISRDERLDMKVYSLTEAGRVELHNWLVTPLRPQDTREPFLIQLFFGGQLSEAELLNLLQHQLRGVEEMLSGVYHLLRSYLGLPATKSGYPRPVSPGVDAGIWPESATGTSTLAPEHH